MSPGDRQPLLGLAALNMETWEKIAAKLGFPLVALPDTASGSAESAIRFLVNQLVVDGLLAPEAAADAVGGLLKRERLGATAFAPGIALPHTMTSGLQRLVGILAHCPCAVPWEGSEQQVRIICLILTPGERPGDYLRALEQISRALRA